MQTIINSLKNRELWQSLEVETLAAKFFTALAKPRLLLHSEAKLQQVKFDKDSNDEKWLVLVKASPLPTGPIAIMFENPQKYQFVVVTSAFTHTANYAEAEIKQVFQSRYIRKNIRYQASESGIFLSKIAVLGADIDPEALKTRLEIIFKANQKSLAKSIEKVTIDVYKPDDEPLIKAVQKTQKSIFVDDATELESFNRESFFSFGGHKIQFARYLELSDQLPYDLVKIYRDRRLQNELIIPILYKKNENENINLGYVRIHKKPDNVISWDKIMYGALTTIETILTTVKSNNYKVIEGSAPIIDISLGGMRVAVSEPEIIRSLPNSDIVVGNLNFPSYDPITVKLKAIYSVPATGQLMIGVKFLDLKMPEGREAAQDIIRREIKQLPLLL